MADVIRGTVASAKGSNNGTLSVTTDAGIFRTLLVGFSIYDTTAADRVLTVDYNGVSMIRIAGATRGANREIELWSLDNPDEGVHDVTFTFAGAVTEWQVAGIPLSNVDGINTVQSGQGTGSTSRSITLTTDKDRCQIYSFLIVTATANSINPNSGETQLVSKGDTNQKFRVSEEDAVVTPAGDENTGFTWTNSTGSAIINVAMSPAGDIRGLPIFF